MCPKIFEKKRAIALRKQGKSYNEILEKVPVAKSTLSLWLRDVGLSKPQQQKMTTKRRAAQLRGGAVRRKQRQVLTNHIYQIAKKDVGKLTKRERMLVGATLYWAEGSKERAGRTGQGVDFGNMDPVMMKFFIDWLVEIMEVSRSDMHFSLYIHKSQKDRINDVIAFWKRELDMPDLLISYVYYKKHNPKTVRKNTGEQYFGTFRVRVKKSSTLQRRISGLIYGITGTNWRIV